MNDIPLEKLGFSSRTYHILRRNKIDTVRDLIEFSQKFDIKDLRGVGNNTEREIKKIIGEFLKKPEVVSIQDIESDNISSIQKFSESTETTNILVSERFNEYPIDLLSLSVRPYNSLRRNNISTIGELIKFVQTNDLLDLRNIGEKTKKEIESKIFPIIDRAKNSANLSDNSSKDYHKVVQSDIFPEIPLSKISITRLVLSEPTIKQNIKNGILTIGDLPHPISRDNFVSENIVLRLDRYIQWISEQDPKTWDIEINNRTHSPLHFEFFKNDNFDNIFLDWVNVLPERYRFVIENRFGVFGDEKTLEEVGNELNVTRERVRQIQKKSQIILFNEKNLHLIEPLTTFIKDWMVFNGGLLSKKQISEYIFLSFSEVTINIENISNLLFDTDKNVIWIESLNAWGHKTFPLEKIPIIQKSIRRFLEKEKAGIQRNKLLEKIITRGVYTYLRMVPRSLYEACLDLDPNIEINRNQMCKLSKWSSSRLDEMIQALRDIGKPSHYSVITKRANYYLPNDQQATPRQIHAHLSRLPDIFIRVGHGIFGLAEWGLLDDGNVANAVVRILNEENQLLSLDFITEKVLKNWRVNPQSVHMAILNDDRISKYESEQYGLVKWDLDKSKNHEDKLLSWLDEWLDD